MRDDELNQLSMNFQKMIGITNPVELERGANNYFRDMEFTSRQITREKAHLLAGYLMGVLHQTVVVWENDEGFEITIMGDSWKF